MLSVTDASVAEAGKIRRYDTRRIRAALRASQEAKPDDERRVHQFLREDRSATVIKVATELGMLPRIVGNAMRQVGISPQERLNPEHPDYLETWFGRHQGVERAAKRFADAIQDLREELSDDETAAFVAGAPSARHELRPR